MRERVKRNFSDFEKAFKNLNSACKRAKSDLAIDGTIKRFELCYELSWKLIKTFLEDKGLICRNPRDCFKYALQNELIENENDWMEMIEDRNLLVHTYTSEQSRKLFGKIKNIYLGLFSYLYHKIKKEF